jgi:hypothetical protein
VPRSFGAPAVGNTWSAPYATFEAFPVAGEISASRHDLGMSKSELSPSVQRRRLVDRYQVSQAIHVAAVLGIADRLGDGARSNDELATEIGADGAGALPLAMRAGGCRRFAPRGGPLCAYDAGGLLAL